MEIEVKCTREEKVVVIYYYYLLYSSYENRKKKYETDKHKINNSRPQNLQFFRNLILSSNRGYRLIPPKIKRINY